MGEVVRQGQFCNLLNLPAVVSRLWVKAEIRVSFFGLLLGFRFAFANFETVFWPQFLQYLETPFPFPEVRNLAAVLIHAHRYDMVVVAPGVRMLV